MQTFLPYASFERSAEVLDYRRLGKQRVECKQILTFLGGSGGSGSYSNHPAVLMWKGYEDALRVYMDTCVREWDKRGYMSIKIVRMSDDERGVISGRMILPWWFGREEFHLSHQSNLVRKDPEFYSSKFPGVGGGLPYWWPSQH